MEKKLQRFRKKAIPLRIFSSDKKDLKKPDSVFSVTKLLPSIHASQLTLQTTELSVKAS